MPRRSNKAADKLNALLGITEKAAEVETRTTGRIVGITEPEIQDFREAQGLLYFLQAPALFTPRLCANPDCGAPFLVSRKHVSYCSYTCIKHSLQLTGLTFTKGNDLESLAVDPQVYNGNEPIWIRQNMLVKSLEVLQTLLEPIKNEDGSYPLIQSPGYKEQLLSNFQTLTEPTSVSESSPTTQSKTSERGKNSSPKPAPKRKITFA